MTKLKWLRTKKAKGKTYYYFDAGPADNGRRVLTKLPNIKAPNFGDCYARAVAERRKLVPQQGILTLDGLIRSYEKSPEFRQLSENSKLSYTRYLSRANQFMRSKTGQSWPVKIVKRKDVIALRDALADTPGAANQAMRAIGALFKWAVNNDKADENPTREITKFSARPHDPWPEELLEEALADPQAGDPVALLYFTGQRINDCVSMSWADIRGDHMLVFVQKKDKHIKVAILPELADRLNRMNRPTLTILSNANGQPWTGSGLRRKLQEWASERGHKVVPHGLRKNAVISLLEAGCTAAEVSGITDQTIQMIEHYAEKVNKLALGRAAVVKLDAHRKAQNKERK